MRVFEEVMNIVEEICSPSLIRDSELLGFLGFTFLCRILKAIIALGDVWFWHTAAGVFDIVLLLLHLFGLIIASFDCFLFEGNDLLPFLNELILSRCISILFHAFFIDAVLIFVLESIASGFAFPCLA